MRDVPEGPTTPAELLIAGVQETGADRLRNEFVVGLGPQCESGVVENSVDLSRGDVESLCNLGLAEALTSEIYGFKLSGRKLCHKPDGISTASQFQESTFRYASARERCVVQ